MDDERRHHPDPAAPGDPRVPRRHGSTACDLSGAVFRDCDLSGARITSSMVDDLRVDGFDGAAGSVVVDGVDVSAYVAAELDRRFPERVQVREAGTADELRAAWATVQGLWEQTLAEASSRPEAELHEQVGGEWSFVETLRHLVFAVDCWVGRMLAEVEHPFDPLGVPPTDLDRVQLAGDGSRPRPRGRARRGRRGAAAAVGGRGPGRSPGSVTPTSSSPAPRRSCRASRPRP